jgi:hypothetical protein
MQPFDFVKGLHLSVPAGLARGVGVEPIVGRGVTDNFLITLDHGQQVIVEL